MYESLLQTDGNLTQQPARTDRSLSVDSADAFSEYSVQLVSIRTVLSIQNAHVHYQADVRSLHSIESAKTTSTNSTSVVSNSCGISFVRATDQTARLEG